MLLGMSWLQRHAWWGLLLMSVVLVMFGISDLLVGAPADPGIALGLSGMSLAELEAESAAAYRLFDLYTRVNGWSLAGFGLVSAAVLIFGFRRDQRWAWWTAWALPIFSAGVFAFYVVAGTDPSQPPPPPMISGPILALITSAVLLVSAPRFFRRPAAETPH
ncbi:MAG TPA: hypothetical protein VK838_00205 [Candidatus Limnocylindrales bacterium]|nr:hypothetical protein [Candidatus Limnocylindrales bacterium]